MKLQEAQIQEQPQNFYTNLQVIKPKNLPMFVPFPVKPKPTPQKILLPKIPKEIKVPK